MAGKVPKPLIVLKAAIIANYGSQKAFARRIGWGEQQVSQAIHGRRKIAPKERALIAQVLRTPMQLLFPECDEG